MAPVEKIFLYGPSGSGKTTIGRKLAEALDLPFIDLDARIEAAAGRTVAEVFEAQGEAAFRLLETAALHEALEPREGEAVVALGGGALLDPSNRARVEAAGRILCLTAEPAALLQRLLADSTARPLLLGDPQTRLQDYLETRSLHYESFPLQLATDKQNIPDAAWAAQKKLGVFRLKAMGGPYDVRIRAGGLDALGVHFRLRGLRGPVSVVADSNTQPYGERACTSLQNSGYEASMAVFPAGEANKNLRTVEDLWDAFLDAGLERGSTVVAVGGGVACDLAGFAAATYLRGVAWVAVPTSLLAMADASLGGKTGADLPQGKNLVGAFHPPALVLADPEVLATLPERELRAGLAEVVKSGVVGDAALFESCAALANAAIPVEMIAAAVAVKAGVIERDPFERGLRGILNFGHTIGHALEHASGYRLLHGEAIAIGMAAEARLAERLGIAAAGVTRLVRSCLAGLELPVDIPSDLDREAVVAAMQRDKKKHAGVLRFAFPKRIGEAAVVELQPDQYLNAISKN